MIESGNVSPAVSVGMVEGLQVLEVIGERGATSIGYRVTDGERVLFMKRLRPELLDDERLRMAFRKEYEVGSRVRSPHVVHYVGFHEAKDNVYVLMEFVAGETLHQRLSLGLGKHLSQQERDGISTDELLHWFCDLLTGLQAIHNEGIVHLDIKPDNLLITDVNKHLVIADLGFAHQDSFLAPVGKTKGYAAPELNQTQTPLIASRGRQGGTVIDVRSDIFSAGRVLQEMLRRVDAGKHSRLVKRLQRVSEKCCAENPADRYASAEELHKAVDALAADYRKQRRGANRTTIIAALLAALLLGAGSFYVWHTRHVGYIYGMELRVTSTDSLTCEVRGPADRTLLGRMCSPLPAGDMGWTFVDAQIPEKITIGGRTYRVTSVADNAFFDIKTLGAVTFPPSIRHIGAQAFKECKALSSLTLPDSLESYGGIEVFQNCEGLETMRLPKRLRTLAPRMFVHCLKLQDLILPDSLKVLPEHAFMSCKSLTEVRIPAGVHTIERGVFWDCQQLKQVFLPTSVETIADFAFGQCPALTDVFVEWPRPIIVADIFARSHPRIHVPSGTADLYRTAPVWKNYEIVEE